MNSYFLEEGKLELESFLKQLNDVCQKSLFCEKVLIVPSNSVGQQIRQAFTKRGYMILNLRCKTLKEIAEDYSIRRLDRAPIISDTLAKYFLTMILDEFRENKHLKYFGNLEVTPGLIEAVYYTISDLRYAKLKPSEMDESAFINERKGHDLKCIFSAYQQMLVDEGYRDKQDVLRIFLEQLDSTRSVDGEGPIYIAIKSTKHQWLKQKIVDKLARYVLDFPNNEGTGETRRPNVAAAIEMFHANGESNEAKEVIRRIKQNNHRLDQVVICYTSRDSYAQLFYHLAQRCRLHMTFEEGISIQYTGPGKLFFGLLEWIRHQYNVNDLCRLLNQGHIKISGQKAPSITDVVRDLCKLKIGWAKERYISSLDYKIKTLKKKDKADDSHKNLIKRYRWLKKWLKELLLHLPNPDLNGYVSYGVLAEGLRKIISECSPSIDPLDQEAKKEIEEKLSILASPNSTKVTTKVTLNQALCRLEHLIQQVRVGRSCPKPGHIHVTHYQYGMWSDRSHTFIVGLDNQRFPGQIKEDPILLDRERAQLHHGLRQKKIQPEENNQIMHQLLTVAQKNVALSYPAYELLGGKKKQPADLLLRIGNSSDMDELRQELGDLKGAVPHNARAAIDETEWWMQRLSDPVKRARQQDILEVYEHLKQGTTARIERDNNCYTIFDGRIEADLSHFDPRQNKERILSKTSLETLGKCPYQYFLKYILGIKEPDRQPEYNRNEWLDSLNRGNLLHKIFEKFYSKLRQSKEVPNVLCHWEKLKEIAEDSIRELRIALPSPNECIFESEKKEILESCQIFLSREEELIDERGRTEHLEFTFGDKDSGDLLEQAAVIKLPSGKSFFLKGRIDRVIRLNDGTYGVIDYKTGSDSAYKSNKPNKGGRQLQHTLYSLALEYLLKNKVSQSEYYFPTTKGKGKRVERSQDGREEFFELLNDLLGLITHGHFVRTDQKEEDCKYCVYSPVCDQKKVTKHDPAAEGLKVFRKVRDYD